MCVHILWYLCKKCIQTRMWGCVCIQTCMWGCVSLLGCPVISQSGLLFWGYQPTVCSNPPASTSHSTGVIRALDAIWPFNVCAEIWIRVLMLVWLLPMESSHQPQDSLKEGDSVYSFGMKIPGSKLSVPHQLSLHSCGLRFVTAGMTGEERRRETLLPPQNLTNSD